MAGKGGKREGAGRPKGSRSERVSLQVAHMLLHGEAPLSVLLKVMRYYGKVFDKLSDKFDPAKSLPEGAEEAAVKAREKREAKVKEIAVLVADLANKAAPFVHSRLTAVDNTPKIDPTLLTPEEIAIVVPILNKCAVRPSDASSGSGAVAPVGSGTPEGSPPTTRH
jgi:hypothetical protein